MRRIPVSEPSAERVVEAPPVIGAEVFRGPRVAPWRNAIMLALLLGVPPVFGYLGSRKTLDGSGAVVLPDSVSGLLQVSAVNLGLMLVIGVVVYGIGRPSLTELMSRARMGWRAWGLGLGYSVLFRFLLGFAMLGVLLAKVVVLGLQGRPIEALDGLRPEIEHMLDPASLRDPLYLFLSTTLISFVVAGWREELWRAAVFAAMSRMSHRGLDTWTLRVGASMTAAVVFGLGHLTQGWSGVFLTGALGFGLGLVMLWHRSLWVAVLTHGFFNATSFLLLHGLDRLGQLDTLLGRPAGP